MELLLRNLRRIKITKEEENNVPLYQKLNQARAKKPPTDDPNG